MMRFRCKKRTIVTALNGCKADASDIPLISKALYNGTLCMNFD